MSLAPGGGFSFGGPTHITWDGRTLTGTNGTKFTTLLPAADGDALGDAPPGGYDSLTIQPGSRSGVHVLVVDGVSGARYTIWFPPGQDLSRPGASLVFDWKKSNSAVLAAAAPSNPFPKAFEDINGPSTIFSGGSDVAATNFLVTVGLLVLLLAGGTVFNKALEENVRGLGVRVGHLPAPLLSVSAGAASMWSAVAGSWAALIPGRTWIDKAVGPACLLLGTGLIYSLLEPGFGRNEQSITIFVSLVVSQGVLVLFYEGGKAWLYRRSFRVDAGLKLFPACIIIALVSVAISRAAGFQPGIVVGFIASATLMSGQGVSVENRGKALGIVSAVMLGVSVAAWVATIPLHALYESSPSLWTALPEAMAISIFVVCLEGLLFSLIPLEFVDGWRIWKWSPFAWIALFVPSVFLFVQILFNDEEAYLDLIASQKSLVGFGVLIGYVAMTFGTWAIFRWRAEGKASAFDVPAPQEEGAIGGGS